jgi:hypothetical protein
MKNKRNTILELLKKVSKYLIKNGWISTKEFEFKGDPMPMRLVDPLTSYKHVPFTAFSIQLERDKINTKDALNILNEIEDYLTDKKWSICNYTLYHIDPVTKSKYPTDISFYIQSARDLKQ